MHMTRQWIAATFDPGPDAGPAERSDAHDRHWTIQLHHARCWLRLQPPKVLNQLQHLLLSRPQHKLTSAEVRAAEVLLRAQEELSWLASIGKLDLL